MIQPHLITCRVEDRCCFVGINGGSLPTQKKKKKEKRENSWESRLKNPRQRVKIGVVALHQKGEGLWKPRLPGRELSGTIFSSSSLASFKFHVGVKMGFGQLTSRLRHTSLGVRQQHMCVLLPKQARHHHAAAWYHQSKLYASNSSSPQAQNKDPAI